ncbi:MAG: YidC/Oxa1 family membrane protein insertase [Ruminococcus sp.]|nr:YidC/Oxa1 family membrane protein insertase [Ruminococcus sp.]
MSLLAIPLGWLMKCCYYLVKNYGIALLLFTAITRLIILPLNIKQQISTSRMSMIQPELDKLKQKYGKNQEKLNEETMKLYSEFNINPMASCLPMVISLVMLWALIPVVYGPLTYISDAGKDNVKRDADFVKSLYTVSAEVDDVDKRTVESLLEGVDEDKQAEKLDEILSDKKKYPSSAKMLKGLSDEEKARVMNAFADYEGLDVFIVDPDNFTQNMMKSNYGPEVLLFNFKTKGEGQYLGVLNEDVQAAIEDFNYTAFGLDLGKIPTKKDATIAIPFISFVLQLATMILGQFFSRRNNPEMKMQSSMLTMLFVMPLFSLYIGFKFPCALGIYWIYSSALALVQTTFLNMVYTPDKIKSMAEKEAEKAKAKRKKKGPSFLEKAIDIRNEQGSSAPSVKEAKARYSEFDDDDEPKKLSKSQQKQAASEKLKEARRRYAEKYGDTYEE